MEAYNSFELVTRDRVPLLVSCFAPNTPQAVVVLAGGTGISQRFYRHFAAHLANRGFRVLTFDYRTAKPGVPDAQLRMAHWGRQDLDRVLEYAHEAHPGLPLFYVAHSVGGQIFGLASHSAKVQAAVFVASQSGYWKYWSGFWRWRRWLDWHLTLPAITRLAGKLPGWVIGGSDLPAGVAREWIRWARNPAYFCEPDGTPIRDHFGDLSIPIRFYQISDDATFAPPAAVSALMSYYTQASKTLVELTPAKVGVDRLGHFGFFRPSAAVTWSDVATWLQAQLSPVQPFHSSTGGHPTCLASQPS